MCKNIKNIIWSLVVISFMARCTSNFEDINTSPDSPDKIERPELLLPGLQSSVAKQYFDNAWWCGNIFGDYYQFEYIGRFGPAFAPTGTVEYYYESVRSAQRMIELAHEQDKKYLEGIGWILKSWMYQVMTDVYGDFPYSEAQKMATDGIVYPVYDTQEEIYYDLISKLESANELLATTIEQEPVANDLMFSGDVMKWRKFANALRLRMLMRISNKTGVKIDVAGKLQELVSGSSNPLPESNTDNAVFQYIDQEGNHAPTYYKTPAEYNESRFMTLTLVNNLTGLNDRRIYAYAAPTRASVDAGNPAFVGLPNCLNAGDEIAFNGGNSYNSTQSALFTPRSVDPVKAPGTAIQTIFLAYSEVQFNLAEARERGLISTGDAATYYRNGILASFEYWKNRIPDNFTNPGKADLQLDASDPYFNQPTVQYTGSSTEKLNKIYLQKWISLFYCGLEGWSEWRRTGIPTQISVNPPNGYQSNSVISEWPRRITYPSFESTYNAANYKQAVERQGEDNLTTRVWWNK